MNRQVFLLPMISERCREDLPLEHPDESPLRKHLPLAIYASAETLKMFSSDRRAVVCAHSAVLLSPLFSAMGAHLENSKHLPWYSFTFSSDSSERFSLFSKLNNEAATVIISYLTHAADVRCDQEEKHSGRLVPALEKFICFFSLSLSLSFLRSHMPFSPQGLQTRTL